jgi:hypothetical protein
MQHTVGINNPNDKYHIGNVYLSDENATSLIMTVTINQFTGGVTNIPITQVREINTTSGQVTKKTFATTVKIGINEATNISNAVKAAINDKIASGGYTPIRTVVGSEIKYENITEDKTIKEENNNKSNKESNENLLIQKKEE